MFSGVPREETGGNGGEAVHEKIIAENVSELKRDGYPQNARVLKEFGITAIYGVLTGRGQGVSCLGGIILYLDLGGGNLNTRVCKS